MNQNENAIEVRGVSKFYNLYERPQDRVKELFSLTKKKYHTLYKALDQVSFTVKKGETPGYHRAERCGQVDALKAHHRCHHAERGQHRDTWRNFRSARARHRF